MNSRNLLPVFFAGSLAQGAVIIDVPSSGGGAQANLTMTQTFTTGTIGSENQLSEIGIFAANVVNGNEALGPFTIELWTDADGNAETQGLGTLVAASINQITLGTAGAQEVGTFSGGLLTDDTVYALIVTDGTSGTPALGRFNYVEEQVVSKHKTFSNVSLDVMEGYWQDAKAYDRKQTSD